MDARRGAAAGLALAVAVAALSLGQVHTDAATTFTVTTASDLATANATCANPCSLRQAITDANATTGDVVITFAVPGPFNLNGTANGSLKVNGTETTVSINGQSDGSTVIHQDGTDRVLLVSSSGITVTLTDLALTGGHAIGSINSGDDGYGGAIDINSGATVVLVNDWLVTNTADNGGGGIDNNTTSGLTLLGTTVSGNTSGLEGGGIDDNTVATLTAINSTISGNTGGTGGGGAIAAITAAKVTLVNDTIITNTTTPSTVAFGAVQATGTGASTISNTIVSGNTGNNCAGIVTDSGNNLEQGSSCGFTTNAQHGDPLLGPLQDNGGLTPTMALNPGSPAIFAGSDTVCAASSAAAPPGAGGVDQRGAHRPQGTHCDIGAFEVVATTTALAAPSTAIAGQATALTATVTAAQLIPGPASGTVSFFEGTTLLGTATLAADATATLTTSNLTAGTQSVTARYNQTPLFLASTSAAGTLAVATSVPEVGAGVPWLPAGALLALGLGLMAAAESRRRR
jgi:hypothetical protein